MGKPMKNTRETRRARNRRTNSRRATQYRTLARAFGGMVTVTFCPAAHVSMQRVWYSHVQRYGWAPTVLERSFTRWPPHDDDIAFQGICRKLRREGLPVILKGGAWRVPARLLPAELWNPNTGYTLTVNEEQLEMLVAHLRHIVHDDPDQYRALLVAGALASGA